MRQAFRKVVTVVAVILALGSADKAFCPNAEASYGFTEALETIGIGAGIGGVLGLSTISFYSTPTSHLRNALVGAGAGLIVGLGVAAYLLANGPQSDEIDPEDVLPPENRPGKNPAKALKKTQGMLYDPKPLHSFASVPVTTSQLALKPQLAVAVRVLELRF